MERGSVLSKLNLNELALGDFYKCKLLCDEVEETGERPSQLAHAVVSHEKHPEQDPRELESREDDMSLDYLKVEAMSGMIESMNKTGCFQEAMNFANKAVPELSDTADRDLMMSWWEISDELQKEWSEELQENGVRGIDFKIASRVGSVPRNQYPWATSQFLMCAATLYPTERY
jgi:hypothetical protein